MSAHGGHGSPYTFIFGAGLSWALSAQSASACGIWEWREGMDFSTLTPPSEFNWKNHACVVCMVCSSNLIVWGVGERETSLVSPGMFQCWWQTASFIFATPKPPHLHPRVFSSGRTLSSNSEKVEFNQEADPSKRGMEASLAAISVSLYSCWHPCHLFCGTSSLCCDLDLHGFVVVCLFVCMCIYF